MHVLLDKGAVAITDNMKLLGIEGELELHPDHHLSIACVRYHREHFYDSEDS
jgi:predicted restriction endonuclease